MRRWLWLAAAIGLVSSGAALTAREPQAHTNSMESLERINIAREIYQELEAEAANGDAFDIDRLALWSKNWLDAEFELGDSPEHRTSAWQQHLKRTEKLALLAAQRAKPAEEDKREDKAVRFYIIEARAKLDQVRREQTQTPRQPPRFQMLRSER
jgi:hypothetical protein